MLSDDDILAKASSTVIRSEGNRILLFNSLSDEMYLVPAEALPVLKLCHGVLTIQQIERELTSDTGRQEEEMERSHIRTFLQELIDRKLLEVVIPEFVIYRHLG